MQFDPKKFIGGVSLRDLRRATRIMVDCESFSASYLGEHLHLSGDAAEKLARTLVKAGYIIEHPERRRRGEGRRYMLNALGVSLANARFAKRFSRATAKLLIDSLIERASTLNSDKWQPCFVSEIRAFGSFLKGAPDLGDLDLELAIQDRYSRDIFMKLSVLIGEAFGERNNFHRLCFGELHLRKRLKARDGRLSFHDIGEAARLGVESRQIFVASEVARDKNPSTLVARAERFLEQSW